MTPLTVMQTGQCACTTDTNNKEQTREASLIMNKNFSQFSLILVTAILAAVTPRAVEAGSEYTGVYHGTFSATFDDGEFSLFAHPDGTFTVMGVDAIDEEGFIEDNVAIAGNGSFNFNTDLGDTVTGSFTGNGVSGTYTGPDGPGTFAGTRSAETGLFEEPGGFYEGTTAGTFVDGVINGTFTGLVSVSADAAGGGYFYVDLTLFVGGAMVDTGQTGGPITVDSAGNVNGTTADGLTVAGTIDLATMTGSGTVIRPGTVDGTWMISREDVLFKPFSALVTLPDANGTGSPDIATLLFDTNAGVCSLIVKDGADGGDILSVDFGGVRPIAIDVVPDINGTGRAEVAVLYRDAEANIRADVVDSGDGAFIRTVNFAPAFDPRGFGVVPDAPGGPALATLGVNIGGDVRAQVKTALTGSLVATVQFAPNFPPLFMTVTPDVTGNGVSELGVLGIDAMGNVRVQIKDAALGTLLHWIQYARTFSPFGMTSVANADGAGNSAISVLGVNFADGRVRAQTKFVATRMSVGTGFISFSNQYAPFGFTSVSDGNGNNADELVYLGVNPTTNQVRAQVKDVLARTLLRQVFFATTFPPKDFEAGADINGNTVDELYVLGRNANNGNNRVQIKDTLSAAQIQAIFFP